LLAKLFDPASDTWTKTGDLNEDRTDPEVIRFENGQIMAVGGLRFDSLTSTEHYDPQTGIWIEIDDLNTDRRTKFSAAGSASAAGKRINFEVIR
jgi:hypothetical protein